MIYKSVTNLKWNKDHTAVECVVDFEGIGTVNFGATPYDQYQHVRDIYAQCIAGDFGPIAEYVPAADEGPQPETIPVDKQLPITDTGTIL